MRYGRYGISYFILRWALGLTFAWIGIDILRSPNTWIGYMPVVIPFGLTRESALQLAGLFDLALGTMFLLRFMPRMTSALTALHLAVIIIMQGIDAVLIRDVGLLGAALSLLFWPVHYRRHKKFSKFRLPWPFRKKKKSFED